ncbi:MAG: MFS transporter [Acetobacteraceae bacterium]|nr:MFS transporter [Acetobacteraceae bacterium]
MQDWKTLLATAPFRALWVTLVCNNLGSWCVIAAIPILVADRYGVGNELVLSLGLRLLPKILLAPVSGGLLHRFEVRLVAGFALGGGAMLTAMLPWCDDFVLFQIMIAIIGMLDVFITPSLLSLRGPATPAGLEIAGNTLCSVADRLAKFIGPALGGLMVLAGFKLAFLGFALVIFGAALTTTRLAAPAASSDPRPFGLRAFWTVPAEVVAMMRADPVMLGLLIAAASYMIMLGGLRPFLFWANRDWFGGSDAAWTGLLAAQGVGALIGALVSGLFGRPLQRWMPAYGLTLLTGILEGALLLALLLTATMTQAMVVLALASVPEILSTATWFTAMQQRINPRQQAVFFSLAIPLWDCGYALGLLSAGLHANGVLSLAGYWLLVTLGSTLPLLPLLLAYGRHQAHDIYRS